MSGTKYDAISDVKPGKYDYKIKARVIKYWRGFSKAGEQFTNFNLILIDNKRSTIHAFVPTSCAEDLFNQTTVGKVCSIKNFTVQLYKPTDKFRCLRNDKQLIFSKQTQIRELEDDGVQIPHEAFDFLDYGELKDFSKQNTYLADLIGIIKKHDDLRDVKNKHGNKQKQAKFVITDGRSEVKVTFWDAFAMKFEKAMAETLQQPVIIILSSCRVGVWDDEVDISNTYPTQYYLNHNNHAVMQLRKMLTNSNFSDKVFAKPKKRIPQLLTVDAIKNVGKEFIESKVYAHLKIDDILETQNWYFNACTGCGKETEVDKGNFICTGCGKIVPHPDKRFKLVVTASDDTGNIQIVLEDREIRTLIGKRARDIVHQTKEDKVFPPCLKGLFNKKYTIVLQIVEMNVSRKMDLYWACNICNNFIIIPHESAVNEPQPEETTSQATTSTYTAQGLSDLSFT